MEGKSDFTCNFCDKSINTGLKRCSRCKTVYYCGREHQVADWPNHKSACHSILNNVINEKECENRKDTAIHAQEVDGNGADNYYKLPRGVTDMSVDGDGSNTDSHQSNNNEFINEDKRSNTVAYDKSEEGEFDVRPFKKVQFSKPNDLDPYSLSKFAAKHLKKNGFCVIDDVIGKDKLKSVLDEVLSLNIKGVMQSGKLAGGITSGSDQDKVINNSIRSDKITWIEGTEAEIEIYPSICDLIGNTMDNLVAGLNAFFDNEFTLSGRTKAMVACYPGNGTAYKKHIDNPSKDGRLVTCIIYLNEAWDVKAHGGVLRIFPESKPGEYVDIEPIFNRMLLFWSDSRNPHEVQPAYATRFALTVWYFEKDERAKAHKAQVQEDVKKLHSDIALMDVKVKTVEKETVEKKIENESMKALSMLSESEMEAISEIVGNHPDPKSVLTQLGIATSIQELLLKEILKRKNKNITK